MKKLFIALASAFCFCVFFSLGLIILFTNTYGVNIATDGLLSELQFYFIDDQEVLKNSHSNFSDELRASDQYHVTNNTDEDLKLNLHTRYSPTYEGNYNFILDAISGVTFSVNGSEIGIETIPDDYDFYIKHNIYAATKTKVIGIYINEDYVGSNFDGDVNEQDAYTQFDESLKSDTQELTIKKGESYEIKLPE